MASKKSTGGKLVTIILGIAIAVTAIALVMSLTGSLKLPGSGGTNRATLSESESIDSSGRVTLAGVWGKTGSEVSSLLDYAGYSYYSDGYWEKYEGSDVYQLLFLDSSGYYATGSEVEREGGAVDEAFEIAMYSSASKGFSLSDQGLDVVKQSTASGAANDGTAVEYTIAIVSDGEMKHLVIVTHYSSYSEYEIYSASEALITSGKAYGISSRSIDDAYNEVVANYS